MVSGKGTKESRGQVMQNLVCHVKKTNKNINNMLLNSYFTPIYDYTYVFHHNNCIWKDISFQLYRLKN